MKLSFILELFLKGMLLEKIESDWRIDRLLLWNMTYSPASHLSSDFPMMMRLQQWNQNVKEAAKVAWK